MMSKTRHMSALLAITVLGLLCYANTFLVPFVLDDVTSILGNSLVHSFSFVLKPRIIGDFTFSLNYLLHDWYLPGYHLVNLLLHIGNAAFVYLLTLALFRTPQLEKRVPAQASESFALLAALLFIAHPLQTQAVTYLAQRVTLLAAFFSLATVLLYLASRQQASGFRKTVLLLLSVAATSAAVLSKENAIMLPLVILLCELTFFRGELLKRCLPLLVYLLPVAAVLFVIFGHGKNSSDLLSAFESLSAEAGAPSRSQYLLTQFPVVVAYLRLFFFPAGQNLDHDQPLRTSFGDPAVAASFCLLAFLGFAGVYLWGKGRRRNDGCGCMYTLSGFGIGWFFIMISLESGLIPIRDVMTEHRMYLPSVGIVILVAAVAGHLFQMKENAYSGRLFRLSAAFLVLILAGGTFARNRVWKSETGIWEDVVSKSPAKGRGYGALGHAYQRTGRLDDAERSYLKAVQLSPADHIARNNLGALYLGQKRYPEAVEQLKAARKAAPGNAKVHFNLGMAYSGMERFKDAEASFAEALKLRPEYREAEENLAILRKFMAR